MLHPSTTYLSPEFNPLPKVCALHRVRNTLMYSEDDVMYSMVRYVNGHVRYVRVVVSHDEHQIMRRYVAMKLRDARRRLQIMMSEVPLSAGPYTKPLGDGSWVFYVPG